MTPAVEAKAYRLWCAATAMDWNCTVSAAARRANLTEDDARYIVRVKKWGDKFKLRWKFTDDWRNSPDGLRDVVDMIGE